MRLYLAYLVLLLIITTISDSKRSSSSRSRSRGSSTTFWTRKSSKSEAAKPSAPEIKKQTSSVQQSSASKPIGWNVDNSKPSHANPPPYSPPRTPSQQGGLYTNPHQQSGLYHQAPPAYPGHNAYPAHNAYNPHYNQMSSQGGYHNQMGSYSQHPAQMGGYPGHMGGYSNYPGQTGGYGNQMGGYGHQAGGFGSPMGMHGGGYGSPYQQGGMFGGGQRQGFGGLGGMGAMGAMGGYGGYGMKKSGGFLGKHAFRNVLGGLFVWYMVSGLLKTPYKVYNYHNMPPEQRQEISLPANVLTLCNENATSICVPGTTAICTQDSKILCVVSMTAAAPCQNNAGELCVNSTIPCVDANDPLCQNKTTADNSTSVNLPCFTNMTLDTSQMGSANVTLPQSENGKFCVTTMAVPDPTAPTESTEVAQVTDSSVVDEMGWPPANITGIDRFYFSRYANGYY